MSSTSLPQESLRPGAGWGVHVWLGVALPSRPALAVLRRHLDVFVQLWRINVVPALIEPTLTILIMGLALGTFVELDRDVDYIVFVAPGILATFAMFRSLGESLWGAFNRLTQQGAYEAMLATPARAEDIAAGEILWGATQTALGALITLIVMALLTPAFDLVQSPLAILALPVAFLMGLLFSSIALAFVGVTHSIHELMYFFTIVITPMFWFSGTFFPLDELPRWAETLGWFIPMTHAVDLFRGLILGDLSWGHAWDLLWLAVVTVPFCWLAIWSLRRRLIR